MLESIRSKATGWVAYFILGMVGVPFILWGVGSYSGFSKEPAAASVNGEDISKMSFNQRYERLRVQQESAQGDVKDDQILKKKLLEELIFQTLLNQSVTRFGMRVGESDVQAAILGLPQFQEAGKFSKLRFERLLQNNGFTAASFFEEFRKDWLRNQIERAYRSTDFATGPETEKLFLLLNETRDLEYLLISPGKFVDTVEISEEVIGDFYRKNSAAFKSAEEANFSYLELKPEDLKKNISVTEAELKTYFEQNAAQFEVPERREVAHILITSGAIKDSPPAKITELSDRLGRHEHFEALAKTYSEDSATAGKGGVLGLLTRAELPPAFAQAAFSLRLGEYSSPVKTEFGWHLIKVTQIQPSKTPTLAVAKEQIYQAVLSQKVEALLAEKEDELARLAFEHPESLEPAAKALGLTVQKGPTLKRASKGTGEIFSNPKVLEAAFSDEVIQQDQNSAVIQVSPQHLLVLRKREYRPVHLLSYEEAKEEIREELLGKKVREKAKNLSFELVKKLNSGASTQALAQEYTLDRKNLTNVKRNDETIPAAIRDSAFRVGDRQLGHYQAVVLPTGEAAVVAVKKVTPATANELDAEKRKLYTSVIANYAGQLLYSAYLFQLKHDATVKVPHDKKSEDPL